ncbi:MAG: enoyl-CoA hydratase/isomerase family protein [Sulfolobaceae archaeon]|nr:enoyl-CoA hydratase/isomerase family protein [Sulfolobaceae archaeon]
MKYIEVKEERDYITITFNLKSEKYFYNLDFLLQLLDTLSYIESLNKYKFAIFKSDGESFGRGIGIAELLNANRSRERASSLARYLYEIYKRLIELNKLKIAIINGSIMNESLDMLLCMDILIAKADTEISDNRLQIGLNSPLLYTLGPFILPSNIIKRLTIMGQKINVTDLQEYIDFTSDIPYEKSIDIIKQIQNLNVSIYNYNLKRNLFELIDERLKKEFSEYVELITRIELRNVLLSKANEFS